jgi:phospholipid/cholesterol/gamma-HCH transport system permease protein
MFAAAARLAIGYTSMVVHAVADWQVLRQDDVRAAFTRQMVVTGWQALPYVVLVALLFGAVVVTRTFELIGPDDDTVLKTVVWGALRELGPLVTAMIIILRSGVAIAAEVALLHLRSGIADTHWRDLDDEDEIVLPRVLGTAISAAALVSCFQFVAIASAIVAGSMTLGTTLDFELDAYLVSATLWQVPLSIAKAALFGAGIGAIACYHGLEVENDLSAIPKAVVSACVGSLSFVLVVDLIAVGVTLL